MYKSKHGKKDIATLKAVIEWLKKEERHAEQTMNATRKRDVQNQIGRLSRVLYK